MENGNKVLSVLAKYIAIKYGTRSIRFLTDSIQVNFNDCNDFSDEDLHFCRALNIKVMYCDGHMIQFSH